MASSESLAGPLPRHWRRVWWIGAGVVVVAAGVLLWGWSRYGSLLGTPKYRTVAYTVPAAPRLVAGSGETVYRIDPTRSQLTYRVAERIVGQTASHATGSDSRAKGA